MPIDTARYHGWKGPRRSPWLAALAIVRVALVQVFRRKAYWVVLLLALTRFLFFWAIIYGVTQLELPPRMRQGMLERFNFSADPQPGQDDGYILFMAGQSVVVMMLLAFTGSLLVGGDFRQNVLPFYLSRRIDRRHYIVGKLAAVSTIVTLMTTIPALALFVEYGMFTSSTRYWLDNWRVVVGVLVYGGVLAVVLSTVLVSLSAWLERTAPIVVALVRAAARRADGVGRRGLALLEPDRLMARHARRRPVGVRQTRRRHRATGGVLGRRRAGRGLRRGAGGARAASTRG